MGYSGKNSNKVWNFHGGHGISRGKGRTYRNSGGQLKKKWNFEGCTKNNHAEFPWVLVLDLGTLEGVSHKFLWDSPMFSVLIQILIIDDMQDNASDMLSFLLKY